MGGKSKKAKAKTQQPYSLPGWVGMRTPAMSINAGGLPHWLTREELRYRLNSECKAHVVFEGPVTRKAVGRLIAYLEMARDDFPEKAEAVVEPTL